MLDEKLRIFNHRAAQNTRPMSSVAFHEAEDFTTHSLTNQLLQIYVDYDIYEFFKLSLLEFVEMPHDIIDLMIEIIVKKRKSKQNAIQDIEKELKG
jgi:hypothetical protein